MHTRPAIRTAARSLYSISLLFLIAAAAHAQSAQPAAAPATTPADGTAPATPPAGPPPALPMESFLPPLPPSVVPPRLSAPHPCRFPHSTVYEHPTGPTVVTFTVTAQGRVTNAAVAQSSGSRLVDDGVRDCVSSFIYAPAMRDGAPIDLTWAWQYTLTVGRRPKPSDAPQGTKFVMMPVQKYRSSVGDCERWHGDAHHGALVALDVEPDGSVKNASVAGTSGDAAIDRDAVECVSRRVYNPATRDGQPVEMRLTAQLFGGVRE